MSGVIYTTPPPPQWTWYSAPVPVGCICPPMANLNCERPDCPRKPPAKPEAQKP